MLISSLVLLSGAYYESKKQPAPAYTQPEANTESSAESEAALSALQSMEEKGRAPKTGYSRGQFGEGWGDVGGCDVRNLVLARDLANDQIAENGCEVISGQLRDPYTAALIDFKKGPATSDDVQIDHVVALSDAWQKGAQYKSADERVRLANDPLNLLAVDGKANQQKGDSDAASWLPPNKPYRCQYVARQIAVKKKYGLWMTKAEKDMSKRVLNTCPAQRLPVEASVQ